MGFSWLPASKAYLSGGNQYILEWRGNITPGKRIIAASLIVFGTWSVTPGCRTLVIDMYNDIGPLLLVKPVFFHPAAASIGSDIWTFYGSVEFDNLIVAENQNTIKMTLLAPSDLNSDPTPFNSESALKILGQPIGAPTGGNNLFIGD